MLLCYEADCPNSRRSASARQINAAARCCPCQSGGVGGICSSSRAYHSRRRSSNRSTAFRCRSSDTLDSRSQFHLISPQWNRNSACVPPLALGRNGDARSSFPNRPPITICVGSRDSWSWSLFAFSSRFGDSLSGLVYVITGLRSRHFYRNLLPGRSDLRLASILKIASDHLRFRRPSEEEAWNYNLFQRVSYLAVVFVLMPFMFVSGLAMSPAITSVFPFFVTIFGGHQTARTLHFFATVLLVLFLFVHVGMVIVAGFGRRCRAMITGYFTAGKKLP